MQRTVEEGNGLTNLTLRAFMNLMELINKGESKALELKSRLPQHEKIAKTMVTFANTSCGKLIFGVHDQRQLVGISENNVFTLQDQITLLVFDH
jgi:ATP-dependent DNA helicase RecG